jgi:hypothetical protein
MRKVWFGTGAVVGVTLLSFSSANLPKFQLPATTRLAAPSEQRAERSEASGAAQGLSEIREERAALPSFDGDLVALSRSEARHRERGLRLVRRVVPTPSKAPRRAKQGRRASVPQPAAPPAPRQRK